VTQSSDEQRVGLADSEFSVTATGRNLLLGHGAGIEATVAPCRSTSPVTVTLI
jgi:hypothetical protein